MKRAFWAVVALYLTVSSAVVEAQRGAALGADQARTGPSQYDQNRWRLIKQAAVSFVVDSVPSQVLLLKSRKPTGSGGLGQPMNDVELLILRPGGILYEHKAQFFMDEYVEIRDVTGDGNPEVLFHSGSEGASDSSTLEHILHYDKRTDSVTDVASPEFYKSGTHGLRWLTLEGQAFLVIANRNWTTTTPLEDRCHYCPSPFKHEIFRWNNEKRTFTVYHRLEGEKSYAEASEALDGDWEFIRRFER
jgi:hypothetical protein